MPFLRQFRDSFRSKREHGKTCMQGCQKSEEGKLILKNQKLITGNGKSKNMKTRIRKTEPEKSGFKKWICKKERTEKWILKTDLNQENTEQYRKLPDKANSWETCMINKNEKTAVTAQNMHAWKTFQNKELRIGVILKWQINPVSITFSLRELSSQALSLQPFSHLWTFPCRRQSGL